jgi:hypothetical protein
VVYDPIMGNIQIIKVDENGNLWRGRASMCSSKTLVAGETLTTDAEGMAVPRNFLWLV